MHVIYIHQYFTTPDQKGGIRSYEMAKRLVRAGHRVSMICGTINDLIDTGGKPGEIIQSDIEGIDVYRIIEPYSNFMSFARRWLSFVRFARQALKLARTLDDVDLVFATSTPLTVGDPGRKAARYFRCPFVFEVRDLWPELPIAMGLVRNPLLRRYLKNMELRAYRAASRCIALSPRMKEGIAETGFPEEKISMIPNSCDLDLFAPTNSKAEIDARPEFGKPGDVRFVYAGAHGLINGLDKVLDAVEIVKRRNIKNVRFCFIGEGAKKPALLERTQKSGLSEYVSWIPAMNKKELARILPQADVGMLVFQNVPAIYNGTSPNKFFDYIACGIPVLCNYPGWLADYIKERRCGAVVSPDDPEAFADAVIDLVDRRQEFQAMGNNARRLAEDVFSRDLLGRSFVETLESAHREWRRSQGQANVRSN